jgi:hypothetical protein
LLDLRCSGSDPRSSRLSVHPFTAAAENAPTATRTSPAKAGSFGDPNRTSLPFNFGVNLRFWIALQDRAALAAQDYPSGEAGSG